MLVLCWLAATCPGPWLRSIANSSSRSIRRCLTEMNLAIVGYGKMGRLIEQLAPQYGFAVKLKLDSDNNASGEGITRQNLSGVDAGGEVSGPSPTLGNRQRP